MKGTGGRPSFTSRSTGFPIPTIPTPARAPRSPRCLPGLANGYSIFLLKGFFDSLPRELSEIDGAGEFRIFWQITMSLSQPILAVIALGAFTGAYSNFIMALLICQEEEMWTLMPWLYQLQQRSGEGVIFASLIVAAVPTFAIFVFCQNVIMRGIVVPVEE